MLLTLLKTIRPLNLVMIAITQVLCWLFVMGQSFYMVKAPMILSITEFILVVIGTVLIAAAGYIQNDVADVAADAINKPGKNFIQKQISEKLANRLTWALFGLGIVLGFIADVLIGLKPVAGNVMLLAVVLLFVYNKFFKRLPVIGNLVISLLTAMPLLILGLIETLNVVEFNVVNSMVIKDMWLGLGIFAVFAFVTNLIREVVKDIQDMQGDEMQGAKTLPIVIGEKASKFVIAVLLLGLVRLTIYAQMPFLEAKLNVLPLLWAVLVQLPSLVLAVLVWRANSAQAYGRISLALKIIMVSGIFTMLAYQ